MSKFVGKFRKQKEYSDDYEYDSVKVFHHKKRKNGESAEIKKLMRLCREEDYEYGEYRRNRKH